MGPFSRRRFLRGAGLTAVSVPLAHALLQSRAVADPGDIPVRFLGVRTYHGTDRGLFMPRDGGGSIPGATDVALSDLTFDFDNAFLSPLEDWRSRITVLDGLDQWICQELSPNHHGHEEQSTGLTGAATGASGEISPGHPSLDFYLHDRLPSPALLAGGVGGDNGTWKQLSYNEGGSPRPSTVDPVDLFREAFPADFQPPDPGDFVDYSAADQRVFEHTMRNIDRLRNELSGSERDKLDAHSEAMQRLIDTLSATPPAACQTSGADTPNSVTGSSLSEMEEATRLHAAVIAQAFACGRSRCATLRIGSDYICPQSNLPEVQALDLGGAFGGDYNGEWRFHENLVHDYWSNSGHVEFARMQRGYALGQVWQTERFVSVLAALDALPDPLDPSGTSTVLDNTIVYWHNEFGHGPHDSQARHIPAVIAGGAGCLRLGRYLRLREPGTETRVPHNRLLTSFAQAMGLDDVGYFGDQGVGADPGNFGRYHGELTEVLA